jgi:hypothetical protein
MNDAMIHDELVVPNARDGTETGPGASPVQGGGECSMAP